MLGVVSPGGIPPARRSAASSNATRLSGFVETGGGGTTATPEAYGERQDRLALQPVPPPTGSGGTGSASSRSRRLWGAAGPARLQPVPPPHGRGGELAQRGGEPGAVA